MKQKIITIAAAITFISYANFNLAQGVLIEKGLAYLASVQSTSKGFDELAGTSIDPLNKPRPETKIAGHWQGDVGITALCLQVFIANGHGVNDAVYGTNVTNAISYILSQQYTSGYHTGAFASTTIGYGTAMAIIALQSALNTAGLVEPLSTQVQNAVNLAMNYYTQDVNMGWTQVSWRYNRGYTSQLNGDMSVNQWVYLALDATDYSDKDIWNKVYGYINTKKASSGTMAWIGYQSPGTWTRGNTAAAIWGLKLTKGVVGAGPLADMMYNYLEQNSLANLFPANQFTNVGSHVYDGGGFYYLIYELAKALALGGKTNFSGAPWYDYLYSVIDGQKNIDGAGNYYWNGWGGQGVPMETALALLSLQTTTLPLGSKLEITLVDQGVPSNYTEFTISNDQGYDAKVTPTTVTNNIVNSDWISTTQAYMHWEIELEGAGNYSTLIKNHSAVEQTYELCFKAYIENNLADEECFTEQKSFIIVPPGKIIAATAYVNAIGGLNIIIINQPAEIPIIEIESAAPLHFDPFIFNHTYNFEFTIKETGDVSPLQNIDIFASDLVDQYGNLIPKDNFTFVPNAIVEIPAGGSQTVQGTLVTPASFGKSDPGLFQGIITAQTTQQSVGITFKLGKDEQIPLSNWSILISILLIVSFLAIYFRVKRVG